jgi:DNA transposition AAA+ family ATPase
MDNVAKVYSLQMDVRRLVKDYIQREGISKTRFAELVDVDRSTISLYLAGKYNSNTSNIEAKIMNFFKQVRFVGSEDNDTGIEVPQRPSFFTTQDSSEILAVCQSCQEFSALGVIVGHTGYGKTFTLKHFAKMSRVCYIECDDSMSCRDMVEAIEKSLGIPQSYGSIWKRVTGIKEFFNINGGYVLIVDEADKLISKYTQKKIEVLRAIFDQANVGLVLAGEGGLESKIRAFLPRLANRVDFYTNLKGVSKAEVESYLKGYKFTDEALREMFLRATNQKTGCFRLLDRTLKNILRLTAPEDEITLDIIDKASRMMML